MTEQYRRGLPQDVGVELVELRIARPAAPVPAAESHLGDRLAAFVDGELDHDARERVQSHLATCDDCLATAEDERRIKSRVAGAAPPDPSALFLAKLMSIAGEDQDQQPPGGSPQSRRGFGGGAGAGFGSAGGWGGNSSFGSGRFGSGALGADHPLPGVDPRARRSTPFQDEQRPIAARLRSGFAPSNNRPQGFPDTGRSAPQPSREQTVRPSAARGRRFAFAAAGAFSVAAVALGSAITGVTTADPAVDEPYGAVTPANGSNGGAGGYSRNGQLAFGAPAAANGADAQYAHHFGSTGFSPAASATALPSVGHPAAGSSPFR